MTFQFVRNLMGVKTDQAVQSGIEALVRWDPKSATEAELRSMEQNLDALGLQVSQASQQFQKEQKEYEAADRLMTQRLAAADTIQRQIDDPANANKRAQLESSLNTLVAMVEELAPEVDREKAEAEDAKSFLAELQAAYDGAGAKLKGARKALEAAQRDMTRADQKRQTAEQRAEASRQAAGLSGATSGLTVALKAMQDAAAKDLAHADAAAAKAKLLQPSRPEQDDPTIAAALAEASGTAPRATSATDRLAAIKANRANSKAA